MTLLLPAVLSGIADKGATTEGAAAMMSMLAGANLDIRALDNVAGLFSGGGSAVASLMKAGTNNFAPALFGAKSGALVVALSSASGLKSSSVINLVAIVVPIVLMFFRKFVGEKELNAGSLASLLSSQRLSLQGALDSRLAGALGFGSPGAFLSGLGGPASDATRRADAAVATGAGVAVRTGRPAGASNAHPQALSPASRP
jgi:hypothetical protein